MVTHPSDQLLHDGRCGKGLTWNLRVFNTWPVNRIVSIFNYTDLSYDIISYEIFLKDKANIVHTSRINLQIWRVTIITSWFGWPSEFLFIS